MSEFSVFFLLLILLHVLTDGDGTLSKSSKKKGKKTASKEASEKIKINKQLVWLRLETKLAAGVLYSILTNIYLSFLIQLLVKSVFERGLVEEEVKPRDVLKNYDTYCKTAVGQRGFENSLAYVTPVSYCALCCLSIMFFLHHQPL